MDSQPMPFELRLRSLERVVNEVWNTNFPITNFHVGLIEQELKQTYESTTNLPAEETRRIIDIATQKMWFLRYLHLYMQAHAQRFKNSSHDYMQRLLNHSLNVIF